MKATTLLLILGAGYATAQSVADLPGCSLDCFATAISVTSCPPTDYVCQCQSSNAAKIKSSVTGCLAGSACSATDLQKIQQWSNTFCPNVLSSAAAPKASPTSSISSSPSEPATTSSSSSSSSSSFANPSPTSSAINSAAAHFGVDTPGTNWKAIPTNSTANRGPSLEAVSIILLCVAAMILAVRFFARIYTKRNRQAVKGIWADEWFALAGLVLTAGITADIIVGTQYSMGRHLPPNTTSGELVSIIKIVYAFIIVITACFGAMKMSVLFLYLRMTPRRSHRITIYVCMAFVAAHNLPAFFAGIFQCTPVHEFWSLDYPIFQNPHCINILPFDIFNSVWSMLEDVVIWTIPIPTVYNLRLPLSRKAPLYGLLAVSLISVACATIRVAFVIVWVKSSDISWNYPLIPFLSNMEACVALMTTSVPALLPLFRPTEPRPTIRPAPPAAVPDVEKQPSEKELSANSNSTTDWDSQSGTAVPSTTNQTDRASRSWSLLSKLRPGTANSKRKNEFLDPNGPVSTYKSQTGLSFGPRTELKDMDEGDEGIVAPGLKGDERLKVK